MPSKTTAAHGDTSTNTELQRHTRHGSIKVQTVPAPPPPSA
jgi:hypothetical protein